MRHCFADLHKDRREILAIQSKLSYTIVLPNVPLHSGANGLRTSAVQYYDFLVSVSQNRFSMLKIPIHNSHFTLDVRKHCAKIDKFAALSFISAAIRFTYGDSEYRDMPSRRKRRLRVHGTFSITYCNTPLHYSKTVGWIKERSWTTIHRQNYAVLIQTISNYANISH